MRERFLIGHSVLSPRQYLPVNTRRAYAFSVTATTYKSLGDRVKARRKLLGLTQEKLSDLSGLGQSAISSIENGGTKWTQGPNLLRLAEALKTTPVWLESGVTDPAPADPRLADIWPALTPENRRRVIGIAQLFLAEQTKPSVADPFPHAPKTPARTKKATR